MKQAVICFLFLGCSFPSYTIEESCIAPEAQYIQSFDSVYGDCAQLSPVLVTLNVDGTLPISENETCSSSEVEECTTKNSKCIFVSDSCQIDSSISLTVDPNTDNGVGFLTVEMTCEDKYCLGVYQVYYQKQ